MTASALTDRLVQRCLLLTSQVLGRVIAEGEYLSHAAVHEIRVATKQLRAAWRLVDVAAPEAAHDARLRLRALHHLLAFGRERQVMRTTLSELLDKTHAESVRESLQAVLDAFAATPGVQLDRSAAENIGVTFRAESRAWRELALQADDDALTSALGRSYRRAKRAARRAQLRKTVTAQHRLRQRSKRLLYQLALVFDDPPAALVSSVAALDELGDELGGLQDLVDLRGHIAASVADDAARAQLTRLLDRQLQKRVKSARDIGGLAFSLSSTRFCDGLGCLPSAQSRSPLNNPPSGPSSEPSSLLP